MKLILVLILVFIASAAIVDAQATAPTPLPPRRLPTTPEQRAAEADRQRRLDQQRMIKDQLGGGDERDEELRDQLSDQAIIELYRHSTEKERAQIAPDAALLEKYAEFLKQPKTGIVRIVPSSGCTVDQMVVAAGTDCLGHSMPGAGASYSWRTGDYRIRRLADIAVMNDVIEVGGQLCHGILVDLGTGLDLGAVTAESAGMPYLMAFKPAKDIDSAKRIGELLTRGFTAEGFGYRSLARPVVGSTYGLRTIAYRSEYLRSNNGTVYNEFRFDKRVDLVIVFTVVARSEDGGLTLLWRELSRKKAPSIDLS